MENNKASTFEVETNDDSRLLVGLSQVKEGGKNAGANIALQITRADGTEAWAFLTSRQCKTLITQLCALRSLLKG